jgi:peroxiredoxin
MTHHRQLAFNASAPDLELKDTSGTLIRLSSLWAEKPLLLAFTRHFGCTQCKEMLEEIVTEYQRIKQAGLAIAVVTQGTPEATALFAARYAPGLLCLSDPERKAYSAYRLERGTVFQTFLNVKVLKAVSKSRKKGYEVEVAPQGQDTMQMSGTFIISQQGKVILPYYYDNIADHPVIDLLLKGVLATRWDQAFDGPVGPGVDETNQKVESGA